MRDINRIPKILNELERIWTANPDFRLGQLIVIGSKPENQCPSIFYIEDEDLLAGLLKFENKDLNKENEDSIPNWKRYPNISRIDTSELTFELLKEMIEMINRDEKKIVITPINLMMLNGAPVSDDKWLLSQKKRMKKLKRLLKELCVAGILERRESKQDFKGYKEIGYNIRLTSA